MLTPEQRCFWNNNGYLVLPVFFSKDSINSVTKLHKNIWRQSPKNVVVDNLETGRRSYITSLSRQEKKEHFKVNDLYLNYEKVRELSLNERLVNILSDILQDSPVLCNTLSLNYGTQQPLHIDSLYMTPATDYNLVATWIALEDCHSNAGPLCYVPGSHKIPIYRFSTGSVHVVNEEFPQWQEYIRKKVSEYELKEESFLPKKGDVFIWHAQLLHGGSPISDPRLTRKSLVSHYFTKNDCLRLQSKLMPFGKGYWMDRPPQPVAENNTDNHNRMLKSLLTARVEHILRTTLHYFRLWKKDVLKFPR